MVSGGVDPRVPQLWVPDLISGGIEIWSLKLGPLCSLCCRATQRAYIVYYVVCVQ